MAFGKGCHLHLIDGSAFIFRAYHALPPLTRKSDGLPVGAVAGFCNMVFRYIEDARNGDAPTHAAVVFDYSSKTFRSDLYPDYKANRPPPPEDLRPQFPLTREATRAFNIACKEMDGFEADDIIATLSRQAREAGGRVTIISSDKDLMQLVGGGVEMLDAMKNLRIGPDEVEAKFGVPPDRVIDVQALAGDSVDNVPGAPGIGIKTAAQLIQEYGDVENLLAHAAEIRQPKRRETLLTFADQVRISKKLVTLDDHAPLDFTLDDLEVRDPDPQTLMTFLHLMEFRTLTKRVAEKYGLGEPVAPASPAPASPASAVSASALPASGAAPAGAAGGNAERGRLSPSDAVPLPSVPFEPASYETIRDAEALSRWMEAARATGLLAIDTETTSLDEMRADLVGISIATAPGRAAYIPVGHVTGDGDLFGGAALAPGQIGLAEALAILKPVLEDPSVMKIGQNMKYDWKIFARQGVRMTPIDDTMLMSYAMFAGLHGHGMDFLSREYLGHEPIPIKDLIGTGRAQITFDKTPIERATEYSGEDADVTFRLWDAFRPRLAREQVTTVYETLERPLVPVLADMEMAGVKVDAAVLARMSNVFAQRMAALEDEIQQIVGHPFNVGSPKQLGEILFDELGVEGGQRGKTGAYGAGAEVLEDVSTYEDTHPRAAQLAARVLDWRQIAKLKSTYTDALQTHVNPETGRVHTSYSIAGAQTGRLASTDPNLQNIPVRSDEGRKIREAFIAPEGRRIVSLDYSQIELRILAHVADIPALKQAFRDGLDIHAMTASEMFGVPIEGMDPMIRRQAKAINFGVIYGISAFGLARNLRIPRKEAQDFIDRYFERFPGIRTYMDETVAFAKKNGFVRTLFGRKINTPEINDRGPKSGNSRRAAINAPIQGAAADIIRRAMIRMPDAIRGLDAKMLLQVHDELIFEAAEADVDRLIGVARDVMQGAAEPVVKLSVPLIAEAGSGASWAEAH